MGVNFDVNDLLKNLPEDRFLAFLFTILALFMPGAGVLYLTNDSFFQMGYFSIFFQSLFYSLPLFIIGIFLFIVTYPEHYKDTSQGKVFSLIFGASFVALLCFFMAAAGYSIRNDIYPLPHMMYIIALAGTVASFVFLRKPTITPTPIHEPVWYKEFLKTLGIIITVLVLLIISLNHLAPWGFWIMAFLGPVLIIIGLWPRKK